MSAPLPHSEPRGRCSIERRKFGERIKWLPQVDGAPAEGRGDSEDACQDFMEDAMQIACRISAMHGRVV